jgi:hypothetical protein
MKPFNLPPLLALPRRDGRASHYSALDWRPSLSLCTAESLASLRVHVSDVAWNGLAVQVQAALREGLYGRPSLAAAVRVLVQEMRSAAQTWDAVYQMLAAAVPLSPTRQRANSAEIFTHASGADALVAHMHALADCERLAELEAANPSDAA